MDRGKVEHEVKRPQKSTRSAPNGDSQRGSPLPFYFRRHKNAVVEKMDGLRNCACSFLQHKTFYMRGNMLAASDVARFYSFATVDIFSAKIHAK